MYARRIFVCPPVAAPLIAGFGVENGTDGRLAQVLSTWKCLLLRVTNARRLIDIYCWPKYTWLGWSGCALGSESNDKEK